MCPAFAGQSLESRLAAQPSVSPTFDVDQIAMLGAQPLVLALALATPPPEAFAFKIFEIDGFELVVTSELAQSGTLQTTCGGEKHNRRIPQAERARLTSILDAQQALALPRSLGVPLADGLSRVVELRMGARTGSFTLNDLPDPRRMKANERQAAERAVRIYIALRALTPSCYAPKQRKRDAEFLGVTNP